MSYYRAPNGAPILFDNDDQPVRLMWHWEVCPSCEGSGTEDVWGTNGVTSDKWAEWTEGDDDFVTDYLAGHYSKPCAECEGRRVVGMPDEDDPRYDEWVAEMRAEGEWEAEARAEMRYMYGPEY